MFWFKEKVTEKKSKYNGTLSVVKTFGKAELFADGFLESGQQEVKLWTKGLKIAEKLLHSKKKINILMFGLGSGDIVRVASRQYSDQIKKFIAVEIDPAVVEIAGQFFKNTLGERLEVVESDAKKFVDQKISKFEKFDLILCDAYIRWSIPKGIYDESFFKKIAKNSSQQAVLVFNYLVSDENAKLMEKLLDNLEKYWKIATTTRVDGNILYFCSKKN